MRLELENDVLGVLKSNVDLLLPIVNKDDENIYSLYLKALRVAFDIDNMDLIYHINNRNLIELPQNDDWKNFNMLQWASTSHSIENIHHYLFESKDEDLSDSEKLLVDVFRSHIMSKYVDKEEYLDRVAKVFFLQD